MDGLAPFRALPTLGATLLILNGAMSFAINVARVCLIHSADSLVSTLSGILKVGRTLTDHLYLSAPVHPEYIPPQFTHPAPACG
jgi:hypothetical protein